MRIIKEGKPPTKEIIKICDTCGCEFAYERSDVKWSGSQWDDFHYVICPYCGRQIEVDNFPVY